MIDWLISNIVINNCFSWLKNIIKISLYAAAAINSCPGNWVFRRTCWFHWQIEFLPLLHPHPRLRAYWLLSSSSFSSSLSSLMCLKVFRFHFLSFLYLTIFFIINLFILNRAGIDIDNHRVQTPVVTSNSILFHTFWKPKNVKFHTKIFIWYAYWNILHYTGLLNENIGINPTALGSIFDLNIQFQSISAKLR